MEGDRHPARLAVTETREQILEQLSDALAKDELGLDDFEARVDRAYQATTEVGLRALVKDLEGSATGPVLRIVGSAVLGNVEIRTLPRGLTSSHVQARALPLKREDEP